MTNEIPRTNAAPVTKALRGSAFTFRSSPFETAPDESLVFEEDALLLVEDGRITAFGPYDALHGALPPQTEIVHYENCLISAGLIDTHVHYPQLQMIGAYGEQLLDWLNRYVFPAERQFADPHHAERVAGIFLRELLRAGTTTAAVYCTVHPSSVDAFFTEALRFNMRMIAGKVLMDRHAPAPLLDTAQRGFDESQALIRRWHGKGRLHYAVTPRFAPSCTEAQLEMAGDLLRRHSGLFMQTHLAEHPNEVAWVKELFPDRSSYLDVYQHAGLVGRRSVFGHAIHVSENDLCTCHHAGAALAHCPTSNLFLGSGLFRLFDALDRARPVRVGLGTDIGAGTSLSQLASLNEAYKIAQLAGQPLNAIQAFWLATQGGARALYLDEQVGTLAPGFEADLCILDPSATPLLRFRRAFCETPEQLLFTLMTLGDDRAVRATYANGRLVYDRDRENPFAYP
jgi:guanine deaminase